MTSDVEHTVIRNEHLMHFIEQMKRYVANENPEQWSAHTIAKDIVYFVGRSIDEDKYSGARGYDAFVKEFTKLLDA